MKESVTMYLFVHMHASMQKHVLRSPGTFTYLTYYACIYIKRVHCYMLVYIYIYTSFPPCRNVSLEPLGPLPLDI